MTTLYHVAIPTDVSLLSLREAKPRGGSATYDNLSHCAAILKAKVASSIPVIGGSSQHTITKRNDPSPNHDVA